MNTFDIYKNLEFIIRKNTDGGFFTPEEYNRQLEFASTELKNAEFPKYEMTQDIKDSLLPFVVDDTITQTTTYIALPANYAKLIGNPKYNDGTTDREIRLLTDSQWIKRSTSALTYPSESRPICRLTTDGSGNKRINFLPITGEDIDITYLKEPATPFMDYYIDANDQIQYLAVGASYTLLTNEIYRDGTTSGSVTSLTAELDWNEDEKLKIFFLIAQKLGVNLNEADLLKYSAAKQVE